MTTESSSGNAIAPLAPNRRRASSLHVSATFTRLLLVAGAVLCLTATWHATTGLAVFGDSSDPSAYMTLNALPQLREAIPYGEDVIRVTDLPLAVRLAAWAPTFIVGLTLIGTSRATRGVLIGISAAQPFAATTITYLRRTGWWLAAGGLISGVADSAISYLFLRTQAQGYSGWGGTYSTLYFSLSHWPWSLIIPGVFTLALAAAFREGMRLKTENDETV